MIKAPALMLIPGMSADIPASGAVVGSPKNQAGRRRDGDPKVVEAVCKFSRVVGRRIPGELGHKNTLIGVE